MYRSFRLLAFDPCDAPPPSGSEEGASNEFMVQMFGVGEGGETSSIFVTGFEPFFYAKVGDDWTEVQRIGFTDQIREDLEEYHGEALTRSELVKRKTLYGFDGGKDHTFVCLHFAKPNDYGIYLPAAEILNFARMDMNTPDATHGSTKRKYLLCCGCSTFKN
jgi:uncharacterized membrane protein